MVSPHVLSGKYVVFARQIYSLAPYFAESSWIHHVATSRVFFAPHQLIDVKWLMITSADWIHDSDAKIHDFCHIPVSFEPPLRTKQHASPSVAQRYQQIELMWVIADKYSSYIYIYIFLCDPMWKKIWVIILEDSSSRERKGFSEFRILLGLLSILRVPCWWEFATTSWLTNQYQDFYQHMLWKQCSSRPWRVHPTVRTEIMRGCLGFIWPSGKLAKSW